MVSGLVTDLVELAGNLGISVAELLASLGL